MTWCPLCGQYVVERHTREDVDEQKERLIVSCSRCNITLSVTELPKLAVAEEQMSHLLPGDRT